MLQAQQRQMLQVKSQQYETRKIVRNFDAHDQYHDQSIVGNHNIGQQSSWTPPTSGKTSAAAPTQLGTADNAFTALRGYANQVIANQDLGTVVYIHRQNLDVFGGQPTDNGRYRYDISTDGGLNWAIDIGTLQQTYTNYGRYPNISLYPGATNNPFDAKIVWGGPTNRFPTPGWIGHVYGVADVVATSAATTTSTETYLFDTEQTLLPGSMVQGEAGEFWMAENQYDGTDITDSIRIMKGTWNANNNDVDWVVEHTIDPSYDKSFDNTAYGSAPVMGFSPDGTTGWIAMTGNFTSGTDTRSGTILPAFAKSTDGGDTWGTFFEVNLNDISWVQDSLQSLWVDTANNPAASGLAFTLFRNFDMVVDQNGNPHMGVVVYSAAPTDDYFFQPGFAKFLADVYSTDGGQTWDASYIAPVLTYDNDFGSGTNTVNMANYVQVSRTGDGSHIFFSWADSDTSQFTGSMNGVGLGETANLSPNLRCSAKRISDGGQTYPWTISDGDLTWEGRILFPTMSPITHTVSGSWRLPIVAMELTNTVPDDPVTFYYWGNDATVPVPGTNVPDYFCEWRTMDLGWPNWGDPSFDPQTGGPCLVNNDPLDGRADIVLHQSYPNPTTGEAVIRFELPAITELNLELVNMYGQQVRVLAQGEYPAGKTDVRIQTEELAAGVYFYNLRAGDQTFTKKMIVTK